MVNNKKLIFGGIIAVVVVGFIINGYFSDPAGDTEPTVGSDIVQEPTPTPTPTPAPSVTEEPFLGLHGIKAPATCQISGEANFSALDSYSSNTMFAWQNVDSQGRLVNWRVSPNDDLKIGPNLFANLDIPNGSYENLTLKLPENPVSKTYLLTTSITYGQIIQDDVKVKETDCVGQIKVNLNF